MAADELHPAEQEWREMLGLTQQPGHYVIRRVEGHYTAYFHFVCPCGCGERDCVPLLLSGPGEHSGVYWGWDGNTIAPTLTPSLRRTGGCNWHGHMRKGRWEWAGDGPPTAADVYAVPTV